MPTEKQEAWALIDPHWGDPRPVLSTIRESETECLKAALMSWEAMLYSGASLDTVPPRPGSWERLERHGYRIARLRIEIV